MSLVVQKYGGTSVGSLDHIRNVAQHIAATVKDGHQVLVTISAMGEQTDDLLTMAKALSSKPPRREVDMLLTAGERISMALLAIALHELKIASVSLTGSQCGILTDETHGNARIHRILGDRIRQALDDGKVVIVAGFQGVSPRTKEITTLGRGGSDLSAIALAAHLGAKRCQLYKDVAGVYTADPRQVPGAKVLQQVSWKSMAELAWAGASVLHPRGAHLASKYNIPFEIRSSFDLMNPGTLICGESNVENATVEALAHKKGMSLIECEIRHPGTPSSAASFAAWSLSWLWEQGEAPAFSHHQAADDAMILRQVVKSSLVQDYIDGFNEAVNLKGGSFSLQRHVDNLATITVVGQGFQQSPEMLGRICTTLKKAPALIDARNTAIILCIEESSLTSTLNDLHAELLAPLPG